MDSDEPDAMESALRRKFPTMAPTTAKAYAGIMAINKKYETGEIKLNDESLKTIRTRMEDLGVEPCANCGKYSEHHHGQHGCCGSQGCHMKLVLAHTAYGEDNVNRLMRRNWPSLRGLV